MRVRPRLPLIWLLIVVVSALPALGPVFGRSHALAVPVEQPQFLANWQRTDLPVAALRVSRTWMWGPEANSNVFYEPYVEGPNGQRIVQYFDKSRMEITDPNSPNAGSVWFVTNGLLARELITGQRQFGNAAFQSYPPAQINAAGDADDPEGPTYASFGGLLEGTVGFKEQVIRRGIRRDGTVYIDDHFGSYGVGAATFVEATQHWVAQPFWDFMNSSGLIYQGGAYVNDLLFLNPFYATGYPITESFWARIRLDGQPRDVLIQCFERRCLTYTPGNSAGFETEAGNVGQHYYRWRYELAPTLGAHNNPIPLGASAALGDGWTLRVDSVAPNANALVLAADPTNVTPPIGKQYFLVRVTATNESGAAASFAGGSRLLTVGQSGQSYKVGIDYCGTIPDPLLDPEVPPSGSVSGNLCWSIRSDDAGSLLLYDDPLQKLLPWRYYFALT